MTLQHILRDRITVMADELLLAQEAAARLGITYRHFNRLKREGKLKLPEHPPWPRARRRYRASDVDALVARLAQGVREDEP
jgi:predicted site-specific integrase-resolvase